MNEKNIGMFKFALTGLLLLLGTGIELEPKIILNARYPKAGAYLGYSWGCPIINPATWVEPIFVICAYSASGSPGC